MGATNYLVKPVRINQCRALAGQMKKQISSTKAEKGLQKYEIIRPLGKGAAGEVNLVRSKVDGESYALKTIALVYLSEKERKSAEPKN